MKNRIKSNFFTSPTETIFLGIVLVVYLTVAFFNLGYYHPDEHYQLIEFAGLKLGWNTAGDLAWEYQNRMRPALQPIICVFIFQGLEYFGIDDPYVLAFFLRGTTALLAVFCIRMFINATKSIVKPQCYKYYLFLSYFLWFIPLISVRYSSEVWSGLSFLCALSFIFHKDSYKKYMLCGLFVGLSFLFRYQTAIMAVGLILWLILIKKVNYSYLFSLIVVISVVIQIGILIDSGFYGSYTLAFFNYFKINILDNAASNFGVLPWTEIFNYVLKYPIWPVGVFISATILFLLIKKPGNLFLWCLIPFLVIHTLIPHKEVRFLFPVIWIIPILVILSLQQEIPKLVFQWTKKPFFKYMFVAVLTALIFINCFAVVLIMFKPAGTGEKQITYFIKKRKFKNVHLYHTIYTNPYGPWPGLRETFYKNKDVKTSLIRTPKDLGSIQIKEDSTYILAIRRFDKQSFLLNQTETIRLEQLTQSIPPWIDKLSGFHIGMNRENTILLYLIHNRKRL